MKVKKILDETLIIVVLLAIVLPVSLNALPTSQIMSAATDADDGPHRKLDFDDDTRTFLGVTDASSTGASYMLCEHWGGNWSDAEKTPQNTEDDLMCWAASASNILEWTGWGLAWGMWNTDQMFQYFQDHWTDAGGLQIYGWDWWFDGTNPSEGWPGWSQVDVPGGNFWPSYNFYDYYHEEWDDPDALSAIDSYLHGGYGVGLAIYTNTGGGHAITVWGYNYNPSNPTDYYGIWISDSDDYKSWTNPPDKIRYYEVSYSGGRWFLQNYYGTTFTWYIGGVMAMEPFPNNRPVADAGGPYTGYVGSPVTFDASGSTDADGDPLQYRWDFDRDNDWDTSWSTSPTATRTWSCEHTGTVALQVYDGHILDVDIASITVSETPLEPVIALDVESGPVGTIVGVAGTGFLGGGTVSRITVDGIECGTIDDPITIDPDGQFSGEFVIPQVSGEKPCEVLVTDSGDNFATAGFEVTGLADIGADPSYGPIGSLINVYGYNFTAITGEDVELELWKDGSYLLHIKTFETDSNGEFSGTFIVPTTPEGIYELVARQDYYNINASAPFKVGLIVVIINPQLGPTGTLVEITGIGFTPDGEWNATFGGIPVFSHETVDPGGMIGGEFFVPTVDTGYNTLSVLDVDTEIGLDVDFEVTGSTEITLDPAYGAPGETIAIDGQYFSARSGETVVLELWQEGSWILDIDIFETSPTGTFSGSFIVPAVPYDLYDIVATQDEFSISATRAFEVGSEPLQIDVYTDKTTYTVGDTMHLGLDIVNTGPAENVCLGIWLKRPDTSTVIVTHIHDITLPHGLDYSNPSFRSFMLPNIPPGVYKWHAALLDPSTHDVLLKDTAVWELLTR